MDNTSAANTNSKKKSLSVSKIKMYFRCGELYRRNVIEKEAMIPTIPLHKGSGVHYGSEINFKQKIESRQDLSAAAIQEISVEAFSTRIKNEGVMLSKEETGKGLSRVIASAKDSTASLAGLYTTAVAPVHQPVMVEQLQRIALNDELDLVVKLDLINDKREIVDLKTGKRTLQQAEIDKDLQFSIYSLAAKILTGEAPRAVHIENLVDLKVPKHVRFTTNPTPKDFQKAVDKINLFNEGVAAGVFLPPPKGSWWCSETSCGYAPTCKFFKFYQKGGGEVAKPFWWGKKKVKK